MRNSQLR